MDVGNLGSFVMGLGIAAIVGAVLIVIIDSFSSMTTLPTLAGTALNASKTAMAGIFTSWYGLIVLAGIAGIVIYLVINGIAGGGRRD
jgi:hypothetical protein